ncbi:hypothetical protein SCHPADRAFT_526657 [Schizopora paradoxa]|uniref:Uncharacterized protein n=1 Tax=Schizopora paradoxa TaxID=27342 RepID=A0A0H2REH7_9AGAM|nr:hypothetical protein SCHPADRAFT_526657 [Schizopora paradoxa]
MIIVSEARSPLLYTIHNELEFGTAPAVHDCWSRLLGHRFLDKSRDEASLRSMCNTLVESTQKANFACEYMALTLSLDMKGDELALILKAWTYFMDGLGDRTDTRRWNIFVTCFKNIMSSGKSLNDFMPQTRLASLTRHIL